MSVLASMFGCRFSLLYGANLVGGNLSLTVWSVGRPCATGPRTGALPGVSLPMTVARNRRHEQEPRSILQLHLSIFASFLPAYLGDHLPFTYSFYSWSTIETILMVVLSSPFNSIASLWGAKGHQELVGGKGNNRETPEYVQRYCQYSRL